jgi:hypothetical protein
LKNLRKTIESSDILTSDDHHICHVLSLYAIDYYDLYNCSEGYNPDFEDVMDDILDYLYSLCYDEDYDIGWVRLPIA